MPDKDRDETKQATEKAGQEANQEEKIEHLPERPLRDSEDKDVKGGGKRI